MHDGEQDQAGDEGNEKAEERDRRKRGFHRASIPIVIQDAGFTFRLASAVHIEQSAFVNDLNALRG